MSRLQAQEQTHDNVLGQTATKMSEKTCHRRELLARRDWLASPTCHGILVREALGRPPGGSNQTQRGPHEAPVSAIPLKVEAWLALCG